MWDDMRALNLAAGGLALLALLLFAWGGIAWLARQPVFALREVVVTTPLTRVSPAHVEAVIRDEFAGTLFTLDLARARNALSRVAWVRSVALRRQAPAKLEVAIEEHVPLARWNDGGLVDTEGEVFVADYDGELPQFDAPEGRSVEVTARYREWSELLAPLSLGVQQVALSARGAWHLRVAGGAALLAIELGREDPSQRLARFVAAYKGTVGALARTGTRIDRVDLRYRNGFAARVPGLPELPARKTTG